MNTTNGDDVKTSNRQLRGGSSGMHPERRITLDSIRCQDIGPHPLSVKVYGRPKPSRELLESIEKLGLLQPLIVNEIENGKYQLLVGSTRREAWQMLYEQKRVRSFWISYRFVKLPRLEAEQMVIESNRQRLRTKGQVAREAAELLRIEKALAQQRMKAGKGLDPSRLLKKSGIV